ncbi:receptor-like protein 34 [Quercus suber]|uniref:Receptor-like protein 34 n=1 Tax=Quercus suber TaxID=58331 RepID=A0AAW0K4W6_QUESU
MIPSSLYNISSISVFSFTQNQLTGTLPANMGLTLPNLKLFELRNNKFFGSIPKRINMEEVIKELQLIKSTFVGLGICRGRPSRAQGWYLSGNKLSGQIPSSIGNLTQLVEFNLCQNNLEGSIPPSIGNFLSLQQLDITVTQQRLL